ncbi:MAG: ribosome maturation factor RimM, partial [Gammaproteobacteria bacterium]
KISGAFGVKGQIRVFSYTEAQEDILKYDPWKIGSGDVWQDLHIVSGQKHGKGIIVQLEGCTDRDAALNLVGQNIAVYRDQMPPVGPNEYYWTDLEGLQVVTQNGVKLGQVAYLFETGSNDVLVVKGKKEYLIPFILDQVVLSVDLEKQTIQVDWDPDF